MNFSHFIQPILIFNSIFSFQELLNRSEIPLTKSTKTITMAQPKSRVPLALGLTAAGGIGYYLYGAGGSPKAAEKQFEGT